MSQIEREFQEYDNEGIWQEVYQRMRNEASLQTLDEEKFGITEARKPENRNKNRYRDVSPYDHSRVILKKGDCDYINASLIEVPEVNRQYILTQGPLENTAGQFWQMIWEQNCKAVVMLNRVIEKGSLKCHQYWPLGSDEGYEDEIVFNDVGIKITLEGENDFGNFTIRWITVTDLQEDEKREVLHFHYTTWPDFGVPTSPNAFLSFLTTVRESGALDPNVGPPVVHCSAGIGRSGTFCLVDSCLVLIEQTKDLQSVDIRRMLINMRTFRMGLIQTPDQLRFSYLAVIAGGRMIVGGEDSNSNMQLNQNHKEDSPPPPPVRTTSLSPSHSQSSKAPPLPPKMGRSEDLTDDEEDDDEVEILYRAGENDDDDDFDLGPEFDDVEDSEAEDVPWREDDDEEEEKEEDNFIDAKDKEKETEPSGYEIRRRVREERKKKTQEQIKSMKERQRKSEVWKNRRSYLRPICIGLTLLLGGYLVWRYYMRY